MTAAINSKPYGIIYCITNKVNGKRYIGQTTRTVSERFNGHLYSFGRNGCPLLSAAIKKYGKEAFDVFVIGSAATQYELDLLEIKLIEQYRTTDRALGYNIAPGGFGGKQSPATIALRVSKTTGMKRTDEFKRGVSERRKGAKHSAETKAKLKEAALNRLPPSHETRLKLGEAAKRRVWTEERRAQAAAKATGKMHSEETKRKLSEIFTGRKQSAETVAKRVAATTGRVRSEETCRRISEARKAYWAAKRAEAQQQ